LPDFQYAIEEVIDKIQERIREEVIWEGVEEWVILETYL